MAGRGDRRGQVSVEAAVLLPVVLTLLAFLAQPACVLYTRTVMAATAGELARLAVTFRGGEGEARDYALRRLGAVPDLSIFHEGGASDWEVTLDGPDEEGRVEVTLEGDVRPLPLFGAQPGYVFWFILCYIPARLLLGRCLSLLRRDTGPAAASPLS